MNEENSLGGGFFVCCIKMPTTMAHVKGSEFIEKISRQFEIAPARLYTVTIEVQEEKKEPRRLTELFDVGAGAFDDPAEIDACIRKERDAWD